MSAMSSNVGCLSSLMDIECVHFVLLHLVINLIKLRALGIEWTCFLSFINES
jgi:hypothetical protein